jgi:hypothetical protein
MERHYSFEEVKEKHSYWRELQELFGWRAVIQGEDGARSS